MFEKERAERERERGMRKGIIKREIKKIWRGGLRETSRGAEALQCEAHGFEVRGDKESAHSAASVDPESLKNRGLAESGAPIVISSFRPTQMSFSRPAPWFKYQIHSHPSAP